MVSFRSQDSVTSTSVDNLSKRQCNDNVAVAQPNDASTFVTTRSMRVQARTKLQELTDRLEEMAGCLGTGAHLPTVVELCREFGVSKMTLQRAVMVLEEQGILQRRHGVGIFVCAPPRPATRRIMLLCDASLVQSPTHSDFWGALLSHMRQRSAANNEQLLLHFAPSGNVVRGNLQGWYESLVELMGSNHYDGVLGIHASIWPENPLFALGIPVVQYAGYARHKVENDSDGAACLGVKALWEAGCRDIGLWSGAMPHHVLTDWLLAGWQKLHRKLQAQHTPVAWPRVENNLPSAEGFPVLKSQREQGYDTALRVFSRPRSQWPDGVYIAEDATTRGALAAFEQMGIEIGRDVVLASHLNRGTDALQGYESRMILVEFDPSEIADNMFDLLESLMNGQQPSHNVVVVPPRLVIH